MYGCTYVRMNINQLDRRDSLHGEIKQYRLLLLIVSTELHMYRGGVLNSLEDSAVVPFSHSHSTWTQMCLSPTVKPC